jgi:hypothetical protein
LFGSSSIFYSRTGHIAWPVANVAAALPHMESVAASELLELTEFVKVWFRGEEPRKLLFSSLLFSSLRDF